ncbi:MAG: hypothetical protein MB53_05210 [marine actinobacterium MedAcidi-G2A]|nr:MAG: hypothetical protein MB53_05210 [marine actinobacterium MedAcidi-G2A]MBA4810642.1 hypothetical protein [Acidimicrobiales bacterium]OUV00318.1 MAG: hypothetical protein CBC37_04865 [Acidimicrobiaceae bacterium TMED77]|tara:strand:- start:1078 stop:1788 length:711 start_codon:yes stop_codon:yes gene_type:complete
MTVRNSNRKLGKFLFMIMVSASLAVTLVSCSRSADGDINAYCNLLSDNLDMGIPDTNLAIEELDLLIAFSPSEVRETVTKIRNTSADIAEITDLDQLFAATFDPEALTAQSFFQKFNANNCDISTAVVENLLVTAQKSSQTELNNFIQNNYPEKVWGDDASISLIFNGIEVSGVEGYLPNGSERAIAESLCQALSLWLYAVQEQNGVIRVTSGDDLVIDRESKDGRCRLDKIVPED